MRLPKPLTRLATKLSSTLRSGHVDESFVANLVSGFGKRMDGTQALSRIQEIRIAADNEDIGLHAIHMRQLCLANDGVGVVVLEAIASDPNKVRPVLDLLLSFRNRGSAQQQKH